MTTDANTAIVAAVVFGLMRLLEFAISKIRGNGKGSECNTTAELLPLMRAELDATIYNRTRMDALIQRAEQQGTKLDELLAHARSGK